jgi:hypothetical protein
MANKRYMTAAKQKALKNRLQAGSRDLGSTKGRVGDIWRGKEGVRGGTVDTGDG